MVSKLELVVLSFLLFVLFVVIPILLLSHCDGYGGAYEYKCYKIQVEVIDYDKRYKSTRFELVYRFRGNIRYIQTERILGMPGDSVELHLCDRYQTKAWWRKHKYPVYVHTVSQQ